MGADIPMPPPEQMSGGILMAGTPQLNSTPTMGKQISVLRIKGTVGEVTGYKMNTSSKTSKSGDFIRSKATSVANPRTYSQAKQRAKARPAQLFYGALENVLNHAFFPLGKPVKNRNRFLSLAMKLDYVPDVKKGEVKLPFAPYQISEGTLGLDSLCIGTYDPSNDVRVAFENLNCTYDPDHADTVGLFSKKILAENPELSSGQELTFIAVVCDINDANIRRAYSFSIVLDESDNVTTLGDIMPKDLWLTYFEGEFLSIIADSNSNVKLLSAGLIISSKTTSSWLYTNSYMALTAYAIDGFDWDEKDIIISYMNETRDRNSDKILQQADNAAEGEAVPIVRVGNAEITLAQGVAGNLNKNDAAIAGMRFGGKRVVVSNDGQLQWYDGQAKTWTGITITIQQSVRNLTLADTTWTGSPTITVAECQANGF